MPMQKIATKVFIASSIIFGVLGILFWITVPQGDDSSSDLHQMLLILLGITVSVILSSFALSVAGKYLSEGDGS